MDRNSQGGELTVGSYDQLPDLDNFLISKFNDLETGILSIILFFFFKVCNRNYQVFVKIMTSSACFK